jgi:hypothetical protein
MTNSNRKRPWTVSIINLIVLYIGLFNIYTALKIITNRFLVITLTTDLITQYLIIKSFIWGVWGLLQARALWKGSLWARTSTIIFGLLYCVGFWVDQIWIAEPQLFKDRLVINLIITITGLSGLIAGLYNQSCKSYFKRNPAKIA